jgi:hypothetical protein
LLVGLAGRRIDGTGQGLPRSVQISCSEQSAGERHSRVQSGFGPRAVCRVEC